MKLSFKKSGGFAGIDLEAEIDTNILNEQEKALLQKIIQTKQPMEKSAHADQFQYEITWEGQTVSFDGGAIQAEELPLIRKMESKLRPAN